MKIRRIINLSIFIQNNLKRLNVIAIEVERRGNNKPRVLVKYGYIFIPLEFYERQPVKDTKNSKLTVIKPTSSQSMMLFMSIHLIYLRRIFVNPRCGLSGDLFANHVRLTVIKVCSPQQAFLLPSPSQREHRLYLWLRKTFFQASCSG